ncbi:MAG TPA: hypothetical protein PKD32_08415 [Saprospiraceae bacterium]|nr:hypothetical protein [Saprospiraceae bacterium]
MIKILGVIILNWFLVSCSNKVQDQKPISRVEYKQDSIIRINNGSYFGELYSSLSYDTLSEEFRYTDIYSTPIVTDQKIIFYDSLKNIIQQYNPNFDLIEVETVSNKKLKMKSIYIWEICVVNSNKGDLYSIYGSSFCNGVLCPEYKAYINAKGELLDFGYSDIYAKKEKKKAITEIEKELGINSKTDRCKKMEYWN